MIELNLAKETDTVVIAGLRQKIWASTYRGIYPDEMIDQFDYAWHRSQDLFRIRSDAYLVYVIADNAVPVGYLTLKKSDALHLLSLYVLEVYQRRGIGSMVFAWIRRYCAENELSEFTCQCHPQNVSTMEFYGAMGGRITARDEGNTEPWQDSVTFSFSTHFG